MSRVSARLMALTCLLLFSLALALPPAQADFFEKLRKLQDTMRGVKDAGEMLKKGPQGDQEGEGEGQQPAKKRRRRRGRQPAQQPPQEQEQQPGEQQPSEQEQQPGQQEPQEQEQQPGQQEPQEQEQQPPQQQPPEQSQQPAQQQPQEQEPARKRQHRRGRRPSRQQEQQQSPEQEQQPASPLPGGAAFRLKKINQALDRAEARLDSGQGSPSMAANRAARYLRTARRLMRDLKRRYGRKIGPNHPRLVEAQERIDLVAERIKEARGGRGR